MKQKDPKWFLKDCVCIDCETYRRGLIIDIKGIPMHERHEQELQKNRKRKDK